jgi:hypothetical protein
MRVSQLMLCTRRRIALRLVGLTEQLSAQVEDPANQTLDIQVRDSHLTGRPLLGDVSFPLSRLPADGTLDAWLPVMDAQPLTAPAKPVGDIHLKLTYKVG